MIKLLSRKPTALRLVNPSAAKIDRKSGSAGMPRPISYAVFCLKKKTRVVAGVRDRVPVRGGAALVGGLRGLVKVFLGRVDFRHTGRRSGVRCGCIRLDVGDPVAPLHVELRSSVDHRDERCEPRDTITQPFVAKLFVVPVLGDFVEAERRLRGMHFFFFNDTATTEIYTLSLHDALPI